MDGREPEVTHYNYCTSIPTDYNDGQWVSLSTGAYVIYNDDPANADIYGNLYNWYSVDDTRVVCPEDWHVPTDAEWKELEMALGMSESEANDSGWRGTDQGSQLAGRADLWYDGALENNSEFGTSGFTALPGGCRNAYDGNYYAMGTNVFFWSSTEHSSIYVRGSRGLDYNTSEEARYSTSEKDGGYSVRCLRD